MGVLKAAPDQIITGEQMPPRPPCYIFGASAGAFAVILPMYILKSAPLVAQTFYFFDFIKSNVFAVYLDLDFFLNNDRFVNHPYHAATRQKVIFQRRLHGRDAIIYIQAVRQRPFQ